MTFRNKINRADRSQDAVEFGVEAAELPSNTSIGGYSLQELADMQDRLERTNARRSRQERRGERFFDDGVSVFGRD